MPDVDPDDGPVWSRWWSVPLGILAGLLLLWVALVVVFWLVKPDEYAIRDAMRLLPDVVRLIKRLAADPETPRGVRLRLVLLLGYLALPIDLIPDFIPVLGYADDAIVVALVLRSAATRRCRRTRPTLARHTRGVGRPEASVPTQ
jgi:uncharacterized membrane protein YkvA (DUF1232 family)